MTLQPLNTNNAAPSWVAELYLSPVVAIGRDSQLAMVQLFVAS